MEIRPILSTLRRHKTAAFLIVLEIALACAIICNAIYLISHRINQMNIDSGIAETELVRIRMAGLQVGVSGKQVVQADLAALRNVPGVTHVATASQIPFGGSSSNTSVKVDPDQKDSTLNAAVYTGNEDMVTTLGLRLIAGRALVPEEYQDMEDLMQAEGERSIPSALINRTMAERLFPGEDAVGRVFYSLVDAPVTVVGVVDELIRPSTFGGGQYSMILPLRVNEGGVNYLLRTEPARRQEVMAAAVNALKQVNPNRVLINDDLVSDLRADHFQQDRVMAWLLVTVSIALLIVTALGIVGLASFWVQQRTRQIGVRRALGATRGQIVRYFQMENLMLVTAGIVLGMLLAYAVNQLLMQYYELPRLPLLYLPVGAVLLWLLGQVAVLGPAWRAAAVPPAVATRSV